MLNALSAAVSGLDAYQEQMDIIGNNIANLNTTGYKSATGNLVNAFSDTLQAATAATSTSSGTNAMQIGTGVMTGSITNDWSAGGMNATGVASNLAINGSGFFIVQDPTSGSQYVTQDGTFTINTNGNLVDSAGMELVGYTTSGLSGTPGPIQINTTGMPATSSPTATMTSYQIGSNGIVTVNLSDGTSFARGQVLLQSFTDPQALTSVGNNLYSNMANAGGLTAPTAPGSGSLGLTTVQSGSLELSNVDLSAQMADLITAQRAFEANSKIITTSDELLQDMVNLKR
jgi:flagellar hook protein FlgE